MCGIQALTRGLVCLEDRSLVQPVYFFVTPCPNLLLLRHNLVFDIFISGGRGGGKRRAAKGRSPAPFPSLPRRHRLRINPQPFLGLSCILLESIEFSIHRRILLIPPTQPVIHQHVVDIRSIRQEHISNGASVLILAECLDRDFFPEGQFRGCLLRAIAIGLDLFRAVYAIEPYAFSMGVVQDFDGVAVEDEDDRAVEAIGPAS